MPIKLKLFQSRECVYLICKIPSRIIPFYALRRAVSHSWCPVEALSLSTKNFQDSLDVRRENRLNSCREELNIAFPVLEGFYNHGVTVIKTVSIITFSISLSGGKLDERLTECNLDSLYVLFWNTAVRSRDFILFLFILFWATSPPTD